MLRRTVQRADPALPILSIKTFEQHIDGNFEIWLLRAAAALCSVFGGLALGLSVIGLYGVKAYSVARRTREIGIRMALGAQRAAVQKMILREGAAMLAFGIGLGLLFAVATGKLVGSLLYEVSSLDPVALHRGAPGPRRGSARDMGAGASRHPHQPDGALRTEYDEQPIDIRFPVEPREYPVDAVCSEERGREPLNTSCFVLIDIIVTMC